MRYIIVEHGEPYSKFEIDKTHLAKVKSGGFDMIIDTEEDKVFREETVLLEDSEYNWFDIKPFDKRWE